MPLNLPSLAQEEHGAHGQESVERGTHLSSESLVAYIMSKTSGEFGLKAQDIGFWRNHGLKRKLFILYK